MIHYFSAKNADREHQFEIDTCWELFRELNLAGDLRGNILPITPGQPRFHASAHYLVGREGEVIRLVEDKWRAYHAGRSEMHGKPNCNRFTIGIELIATNHSGFTEEQYEACARLVSRYCATHAIPLKNVLGHEHVAPGRKFDPGPLFRWEQLFQLVTASLPPAATGQVL